MKSEMILNIWLLNIVVSSGNGLWAIFCTRGVISVLGGAGVTSDLWDNEYVHSYLSHQDYFLK